MLALLLLLLAYDVYSIATLWDKNVYNDGIKTKGFVVIGPEENFMALETQCTILGGVLFSSNSDPEIQYVQNLVNNHAPDKTFFIGAKLDGSELSFLSGEPNVAALFKKHGGIMNGGGECVESFRNINKQVQWKLTSCESPSYSVCQHELPQSGFCYQLRWVDAENRRRKHMFDPITQFPPNHIIRQPSSPCSLNKYGGTFITPIAAVGDDTSCSLKSGGEAFYGYGYPTKSSSNIGYLQEHILEMMFVVDSAFNGYWVVAIDAPRTTGSNSNYLDISIASQGSVNDINVLLMDDPAVLENQTCSLENLQAKYSGSNKGCYSWENGKGNFIWQWNKCCTDRMVLGPLPKKNFCLDIQVNRKNTLTSIALGHQSGSSKSLELENLPFMENITVCGYECDSVCETLTTCGACANHDACGWCGATQTCSPVYDNYVCPSDWRSVDNGCCDECSVADSCTSCVVIDGCGWDHQKNGCLAGDSFSRRLCMDKSFSFDPVDRAFEYGECFLDGTASPTPTDTPTDTPTAMVTFSPSEAPVTFKPTDSPTNVPTNVPTDVPTDVSTDAPTDATTDSPVVPTFTSSPSTDFAVEVITSTNTTSTTNSITWIAWGIPLILLSSCCCFVLVARRRKRDRDDSSTGIESTDVVTYQENPMGVHALTDAKSQVKGVGSNALINAIMRRKQQGEVYHLYTNNPKTAQTLMTKTQCFVKCTEDTGVLMDKVVDSSRFNFWGFVKMKPSQVTVLKIKKLDQWTQHVDPANPSVPYYYNGKQRSFTWSEENIKVKNSRKQCVLKFEFAPDEFDDLGGLLNVLNGVVWQKKLENHLEYFEDVNSKDRLWLE